MSALPIRLPNKWVPRGYQRKLWQYLEHGGKRAVAVWHRRAGKDDVALNWAAVSANDIGAPNSVGRVGNYWHMLPEATQARKAIWEAVNPHTGIRRIDEAFPPAIRETTREQEMLIKFKTGSTWQVVGSDNYNSLVGSSPVGIVFSEWALANPQSWAFMRPILLENNGWALFIYTPRGRNHGATFYEGVNGLPEWFSEKLTAQQTPVFTGEQLKHELEEYTREYGNADGTSRFNQEYLCDFNAAVVGAYFGQEMNAAEVEGRICSVPHDPAVSVQTWWDLGIDDSTVIWFVQYVGRELHVIDYIEANGEALPFYAKELDKRPYKYGSHVLPHDAAARELGTGKTRVETLQSLGLRSTVVVPAQDISDGINAARLLIPRCYFDEHKCKRGIEALRQYRREYDDKLKAFKSRPLHDWASHAADAFRTGAMGGNAPGLPRKPPQHRASEGAWMG